MRKLIPFLVLGILSLLIFHSNTAITTTIKVLVVVGFDYFRYEDLHRYSGCKLEFLGIPNIHVMRESYVKLRELIFSVTKCISSTDQYYGNPGKDMV
jgi:hypothetical protein